MSPTEEAPNNPFGRAVWDVLKKHGLSSRGQRARTGIPGSTVTGWFKGIPPQTGNVIAFAQGFGLDVNEWLELAGYEPIHSPAEGKAEATLNFVELFLELYRQLQAQYPHLHVPLPSFRGGLRALKSEEEAREMIESLRQDVEAGHFGDPRGTGEGKEKG